MISVETYERVALEDSDEQWDLDRGHLRSKPGGSVEHNHVLSTLHHHLALLLAEFGYDVRVNTGRLRVSKDTFFVPDLFVIPHALVQQKLREAPLQLEVYDEPVLLVVEVWSPSTGDYDVEEKLREYQRREDLEIWRIHPYERTLTAWRRQPEGSYVEAHYMSGRVQPLALAGVVIELARLFE